MASIIIPGQLHVLRFPSKTISFTETWTIMREVNAIKFRLITAPDATFNYCLHVTCMLPMFTLWIYNLSNVRYIQLPGRIHLG